MVVTRQWGWEERTDVEGTNLQQVINQPQRYNAQYRDYRQ